VGVGGVLAAAEGRQARPRQGGALARGQEKGIKLEAHTEVGARQYAGR
jgi:hypothetical protein